MSVRHGLLAILRQSPSYGYQLRADFEARTGGTWPVNIGQIYTTLDRLERDGLVAQVDAPDDTQKVYAITEAGRADVDAWLHSPVARGGAARDELAVKLALAVALSDIDVRELVQTQRHATLSALQDLTRLKRTTENPDLAWELTLESMIFQLEAEVRWLDHSEARIARVRADAEAEVGAPVPERAPASSDAETTATR